MKSFKFFITFLLTGLLLYSSCTGPKKGVPDRPNILLILSDDQSPFTLKTLLLKEIEKWGDPYRLWNQPDL